MPYYLGVDVGTTYTAAAVWRDGKVEVCSLGLRAPVVPSVVFACAPATERADATPLGDGELELLVGEAAARRGAIEPQRIAREFKRRMGDPTPIVLGDTSLGAETLMAQVLRWVVETVTVREGGAPAAIGVSHPANWGTYKKDLFTGAIAAAGITGVTTVTEPEAAAIHYASQERVEPGSVVAVYDLGGGTFDVALLRKVDTRWQILGEPEGIERLGGIDFDEAVFRHVAASVDGALAELDEEDPKAVAAVARLRRECVEAKEALSYDSHVSIPVLIPPEVQADVRLTRGEFEEMIKPPLGDSIDALRRALRSAKVEVGDISRVLLAGGSSRIPLVAQLVTSELGRPVAVDAHPKYAVALGAAILAAESSSADPVLTSQIVVPAIDVLPNEPSGEGVPAPAGAVATGGTGAPGEAGGTAAAEGASGGLPAPAARAAGSDAGPTGGDAGPTGGAAVSEAGSPGATGTAAREAGTGGAAATESANGGVAGAGEAGPEGPGAAPAAPMAPPAHAGVAEAPAARPSAGGAAAPASLPTEESAAARPDVAETEVAPAASPPPKPARDIRQVHVPAPQVAPMTPAHPVGQAPWPGRTPSGGRRAAVPAPRRRSGGARLLRWLIVVLVLACLVVAALLVLQAVDPDAFEALEEDFRDLTSGL